MSSNIQPTFVWQEGRQFDGRSQHVVVPHGPKWLLDQGVVLLDFTADRLKGVQGLLSKDAKGFLDGGHLSIWLDEGKVVVRIQDKKGEYVVQSPPNTVKRGAPTRLALAFGPDGVKLYVDGKMVGSNAYQGGLQGNEEPVVIGARDWKSGPRAADHLEAFFAGRIGALALYDRPLDAPAIAALGPAGTALAQATAPAVSTPPTTSPEVAVEAPPAGPQHPTEVPIDFQIRTPVDPVMATTPSIQVVLTESQTIVANIPITDQPVIPGSIQVSPTPVVQVRGAAIGLIRMTATWPQEDIPALLMFEERATKASPDVDQQRAALFVELVKAAFKPRKSDQELRALDWWARVMKEKRIEAAKGAQQAYADWQRDPQGTTGQRASRFDVMFGNVGLSAPSYEALLASGFARVSGPGLEVGQRSWNNVMARLEAAKVELQKEAASSIDVLAIIDAVVSMVSILYEGFGAWTTATGSAYSIASERWKQIQEAEDLPHKLEAFAAFARGTTPSVTESLYLEGAAQQAYVALIEKTL
jgi:Concanavalin A-like lectin/glucanases superfamily